MKKTLSIISFILALTAVTSCDWFTLDNQDGWDAKVEGALIDSKTGEPATILWIPKTRTSFPTR